MSPRKLLFVLACFAAGVAPACAQPTGPTSTGGGGGGTPGGSNTQLQYNNSGAFGGLGSFFVTGAGTASETLTYFNPVATTGVTNFVIKGGAGQNGVPFTSQFLVQKSNGTDGAGFNDLLGFWVNDQFHLGDTPTGADTPFLVGNAAGALDFVAVTTNGANTSSGAFNFELKNNYTITSGIGAYFWLGDDTFGLGFAPTSGTGVFNGLWTNWVINQTGGANGITRGVYVNNTITAAADYRALELSDVGTTMTAIKTGNGKIFFGGLVTDATKTDATVCEDTTTHQLYFGSGTLGICLGTSSARFKPYMAPIAEGLPQIMALQPIKYKLDAEHGDPDKILYGFTAEQGGDVLPELMGRDTDGRPNTFDYLGVVPVLVKAIQEQQKEIALLKKMVEKSAMTPTGP